MTEEIEKIIKRATDFIDENPNIRTVSASLTKEYYQKFIKLLPEEYKIVSENLNLNNNTYEINLEKATFNWLTRSYR